MHFMTGTDCGHYVRRVALVQIIARCDCLTNVQVTKMKVIGRIRYSMQVNEAAEVKVRLPSAPVWFSDACFRPKLKCGYAN